MNRLFSMLRIAMQPPNPTRLDASLFSFFGFSSFNKLQQNSRTYVIPFQLALPFPHFDITNSYTFPIDLFTPDI